MQIRLISLTAIVLCLILFEQSATTQTTKTIGGSGADYATLKTAFDDINAGSISGAIILQITGSTSETATATLNASGTGSSNFTSVTIYPTGSGYSITGNLAPLINLNGAINVSIDGRINQTGSVKSLTIANLNTGGAVIQFINDAKANDIKYCSIQGVTISATSGLIVFSTGITSGNDNNTVEYCDIGDGSTTPTNSIYSAGTSASVDNSGISITNCNIYNFYSAIQASNGILIASNSSSWTITENKFYQSANRTTTVGSTHHAINIITASGVGYTVNNNIIGFANNASTGTTIYDGAFANLYRAIELTVGTSMASCVQGNTISGISLSTTSGLVTAPGIFSGISVLGGNVNIGTTVGNTIGATSGNGSITITSTTSLGYIAGFYAVSNAAVSIQNNTVGSVSTGGSAAIGYTFYGINTTGTGSYTISSNTIGSISTPNSISIGTSGTTTTGVCTLNGITNAATGTISITGNTIQNCSASGTAASVFTGISNSGGSGTLNITGNNIIAENNTGTGAFTMISNSAAVATLNINGNIIRSHTESAATGAFTAITNTGAAITAININNNQLGNSSGGLITYSVACSGALTGISNTAGAATCALSIQNNDFRGIVYAVAGSGAHSYITNSAATLSQNISNNSFTNLAVNTTGNVTFITVSNALGITGVQTVNANSIVTAFSKTATGGTVTFCSGSGTSANGSSLTQNSNNFSNVTVTGATVITGWANTNTSLNKTFNNNVFRNWTGGSAAVTAMSITTGSSTISGDTISNITTSTAAAAPIIAISSGATEAMTITNNVISGLVTGTASFINSFTGITNVAGNNITITGNTITGCTAGGTAASIFTGITVITAGSGTGTISNNSIIACANAGTGAFTGINNAIAFSTININSNIIRNCSVATGALTAISNSGAALTAININNNQMGNASGGLVTYGVANAGALTGITNTAGASTCALSIRNNDIRGIFYSVAGSGAHTYITNSGATLTQNISGNTFTNLSVNTTGNVTFITVSNGLGITGVQTVYGNSIVTGFSKTGAGGTVTFCSGSGTSANGSSISQNSNNFSNVTVTGATVITGWLNTNTSLNKTFNNNAFRNWTGGSAAVTAMSITAGSSTISGDTISNITTSTAAAAPITAISSGATEAMTITNTLISGLVTGTAAFINSFTGISNVAGNNISITGNTITGCTAGGTAASIFTGITVITAGSGTGTISNNSIISCTNAGTGAFTAINNAIPFSTININNNIIRSHTKTAATGAFTAIVNSGACPAAININSNQLGNADGGLVTYNVATAIAFLGISNTGGLATCALSIQNNDIRGIVQTIAGTNAHTYIINAAATLSQNISGNTFTGLSVNTTGQVIFISDNVIMPANGVQNVNNNSISGTFTRTAASGDITLFTSSASTDLPNVTVTNNNNNFSNITINGTATISGWINTDAGVGIVNKTISGNTFNNWSAGTGTGVITAMNVNITSPGNATTNNTISNITSAGTITGIITAAGNDNIFLNTLQTLVSTGGTTTAVNGIAITGGTTKQVYQNTIYALQVNNITTGSVSGIAVSGGLSDIIYRNKIYNISSASAAITTGTVNGILVSGAVAGQVTTIYNNLIGGMQATAANAANPVNGISIANTGTASASNVYYNTVYLNATSTGANFGSSGIYHAASITASTATLDLRNNIVANLSTPNGTGLTVAYRRSAGTVNMLNNYASTSNNNLFYAGTPAISRLIYSDVTSSAQTLALYNAGTFTAGTIAPRDQASVTENPAFISTAGADPTFLHISTGIATQIESGAITIASVTNDFDGDIREGNPGYAGTSTTAPDLGADEGNFIMTDLTAPAITYTLIANTSCLNNPNLSAAITDASGINTSSGTKPRIYYKRSSDANAYNNNTSATAGWKSTEALNTGSPFNFTMDFTLLSGGTGVTAGQTVQYFVVAQDLASSIHTGINSGTFAVMPSGVALTSAAFPITGTINSYTLLAGLSGTVTIGAAGTYPSLTGAGGLFSVINTNGLSGNLAANIIDASITETGATALNIIGNGCTSNYTLTIRPNTGLSVTLTGSVAGPLINLNGAHNVTIDGLNAGGSSLTIINTSAAAAASTIQFIADASNNIITNCTIEGAGTGAASGTILFSTGAITGNDGNTISSNTISPAGTNLPTNAVYSAGTSVLIDNSGNSVINNNIQDFFNAAAASNGILIASNSSSWTITENKFYQSANRTTTAGSTHHAINIITASGVGYTVNNNIVGFANSASTGTTIYTGAFANLYRAIEMTVGTSTASDVQGNTISGISLSTTSGLVTAPGIFSGISVLGGNVNIGTTVGNTIGATSGNGSITITSTTSLGYIAGFYAVSNAAVSIQNNTVGSVSTGGSAAIGYTFYGINTTGTGSYTISSNTIGSISTPNSISIGTSGTTTTGVCTLNGITNAATGTISITGNTIQNCSASGTAASVFTGISNSGGSGTLNITGNNIIAENNTGTGAFTMISNSAAVATLNINGNIIRSHTESAATGAFTAITNTGAAITAININNNQLGNSSGGLITYSVACSGALTGISNTAGAATCALSIQNNDFRGIVYAVAGSGAHSYITNSAATLSQNISNNSFTNLAVNTTGNVTFITVSNALGITGVQTVNANSIVTAFSKTATGGTVTFCSGSGTSANGSSLTQNSNNFSNVTVTGATVITGWANTNTSLNKTFNNNVFRNWTGGSAAVTAMSITAGSSTISGDTISNITTSTAAAAPIIAISSGATEAMTITNNVISGLVTGTASFINSFTGITNVAGNNITITGNTITGCTAGGTAASIFTGITVITAGSGTGTISNNSIIACANAGTGAFTGINNAIAFSTININSNIIRNCSVATGALTAISNSGAALTAININNNQMGNASGGLVTYGMANAGALTGITNTAGASTCALSIRNNDIRGIFYSVAGSGAHTYITNSGATLTQNISGNTFTNLSVNTTGNVTFITVSNGLGITGVQTVYGNSIVTGFSKTGAGGTVTFCSGSGTSANGSSISQNSNNFSNVTVTGATVITGWLNTNTSLNKTFNNNAFRNWTGGSAAVTAMSITAGSSTISGDTISNITTSTAAAAPITAISSGATEAMTITNTLISGLVTGTAAFINSFTGISNVAGNNISITGNTITGCTAGGTAASIFTGITVITAGSGTGTISNNSIISCTNAGTGAFTAINNAIPFSTININNNIIRSHTKTAATGAFTAIVNSGACPAAININSNQLGNADGGLVTYNVATAIAFLGISNTGGLATCALSIQNNDIRGIVQTIAGTNAHTYIINAAATLSQNISGNTFTGLSVNTTGQVIFISDNVIMPANGVQNVNNNSISGTFTRTAASGDITLFTSSASTDLPNVTVTNNNNNFSNITINGTATISGWINTDAGVGIVNKTISGNTFNNWSAGTGTGVITAMNVNITSPGNATTSNTISNITSAGTITGITTGAGNDIIFLNTIQSLVSAGTIATAVNGIAITGGTTKQVYQNTIFGLQTNNITTGKASGIAVSGGLSNAIFRNRIYNISSASTAITTGTVNGILVSGAVTAQVTTIYNNLIGGIQATAASAANPVNGISIANTGTTSATNVYYNTIYLNATSTGTNFGSSGIYHTANVTATTATLDLRNNIIVNLSAPNGTGLTTAYRRSAGTANRLNNYAATSNNNLFYAGIPDASHLIYSDNVSVAQDLQTYQAAVFAAGTIAPRDQVSISENAPFLSTTGSDASFLKINTMAGTFIESGAVNIGIPIDFEGDIRAGNPGYPAQLNGSGTSPDIGADEFDGRKPAVIVAGSNANSNGNYANLSAALTAINLYSQAGYNISVKIIASSDETETARLNAGTWTTLTVFPTGTGISISGTIDSAPLIDLNGADNITLDGRVNGTGTVRSLTITNHSTSSTSGTSTIRFINSAENNIVKYCNILGSSTGINDGIITFSSSATANGNDNNVLEFCNFTNAGNNRPVNVVYSCGSSLYDNSGNTISNNTMYNFFNASGSSSGINISSNSTNWTITGNSFYESSPLSPNSNTLNYCIIAISNTSGNNFIVTGNKIGGSEAQCGGSPMIINSDYACAFQGIYLNVGTSIASSIQDNTITNFNYNSNGNWYGIRVDAGSVNIGTTNGNTVGATSGTGIISLSNNANSASGYGIYILGQGTVNISNNMIGSISAIGNVNYPYSFYGIFTASSGGTRAILNNLIGSAVTANSIQATGTVSAGSTPQFVTGICCSIPGSSTISGNTIANMYNGYSNTGLSMGNIAGIVTTDGINSIQNNTIRNLSTTSPNTNADNNASVIGISQTSTSPGQTVSNNTILDLSNTYSATSTPVAVNGIYYNGPASGTNAVSGNFIVGLTDINSNTASVITGIRINAGATTYANNIITLGVDVSSGSFIYGIYENGAVSNDNNLYFNTVSIGGNPTGSTSSTYALYNAANSNIRNFRNNILSNARTGGTGGKHYAVCLSGNSGLTIDFNDYNASGNGGVLGNYNGTDKTTLAAWQVATRQDVNSLGNDPGFANAGGKNATDYKVAAPLNGVTGTGVILDYGLVARGLPPNIGAWEFFTNRWKGTVSNDFAVAGNWTSSAVPVPGASIVFDLNPVRDCYLYSDQTIGNISNSQSTYNLIVNGKKLSISGNFDLTNGAYIDATASLSTIILAGTAAQVIPDGAFAGNQVYNFTVDNNYGVSLQGDLTVNDTLNLHSANPSDILGSLDLGTKTLTLGGSATTVGQGDVTGIVKRTTIMPNTLYTFGNKFTNVSFINAGTLPSTISVKTTIGAAPSWKPGAIKRIYDIIQTGADVLNPTSATVTASYLDSELNGNDEDSLVFWSFRYGVNWLFEQGKAGQDVTDNWVRLTNVNMAFFSSSFDAVQVSMAKGQLDSLTWNGSVSTSWTTVNNWTPMGAPSANVRIIIPDASTTANDPSLPPQTSFKAITIKPGGIVNSMTGAQATIQGGTGAWKNLDGTFNPGNSTVIFTNPEATISGSTAFNNVTISNNGELWMENGSSMSIAGTMNNAGPLQTVSFGNTTVEYNGGNQNIVVPNSATNRYSTLILSGTGIKTMPGTALAVYGDLILSGSVSITALNDLEIRGNFSIGSQAAFIAGSHNHSFGGNFTHDGAFSSAGSSISFNGLSTQSVSGISPSTTFNNLTILSSGGVTATRNISVDGILDLQIDNPTDFTGCLDMGSDTLLMGPLSTTTGTGDVTGVVRRTNLSAGVPYTFGNPFTSVTFDSQGTLPSDVSIKITLGTVPAWKLNAITRIYDFAQTGGTGCFANVASHYLPEELNGNDPAELVYWGASGFPSPVMTEWGRSVIDTVNEFVLLNNIPINLWPNFFNQQLITLANSGLPTLVWNGSQNTAWDNPGNWTPMGFPDEFKKILIPDATTTANDPLLPSQAGICSLTIQNGGILNAGPGAQLIIYNHNGTEGWNNTGGTFNPLTSSVIFVNPESIINGTTNFYNLSLLSSAKVTLLDGSDIRISGTLTNAGILDATQFNTTIEYNGSDQPVVRPNSIIPGYHNLILSGTGNKTMPGTNLSVYGDLIVSGTATVTAVAALAITGNFTIGPGTNFILGAFSDSIGGNFSNNGTITAAGSTITLDGIAVQTVGGSSPTTFNNLTLSNTNGALFLQSETINGTLTFINGIIATGSNKVNLGSSAVIAGAGSGNYVYGNLSWVIDGPHTSRSFAIGDAANYLPVSVDFSDVTTSGTLTCSTTATDHPDISSSGINALLSVNRYWTLLNASTVFSSYNATFPFVSADIDPGTNSNNIIVKMWDGSGWNSTATINNTATSVQISGENSFGDFQAGEICVSSADPTSASASPSLICNGQGATLSLNGGGGGSNETIRWYTGSCGGTYAGSGNNLFVSPSSTTTYWGRYRDGSSCQYTSACAPVTITVNQKPSDPVSASADPPVICYGGSTSLTLNGGGGGTGQTITWYTESCGGTLIGTGNGLSIIPAATTTYFGRYEVGAPCSYNSDCASIQVTVNALPAVIWPGTLTDQCITAETFTLTGGSPSGGLYSGDGITGNNFNASAAGEGVHTLTYTYTGSNGCSNAITNTITVYPLRSISGTFSYFNTANTPLLKDITVGLYQGGIQVGQDYSITDGSYMFSNLCPGTYELRATSTTSTVGSINTADAAHVNSWSVNPCSIEKVTFNAGDVTHNNWLGTSDAKRIQLAFVNGGSSEFTNTPWTFWVAGDTISSNPSPKADWPTVVVVGNANVTAKIYGLCTGDFNRSFIPSGDK